MNEYIPDITETYEEVKELHKCTIDIVDSKTYK